MTFHPSELMQARSAIDLRNDDGEVVATLYGRTAGFEIVCTQGWSAEFGVDILEPIMHLLVTLQRD